MGIFDRLLGRAKAASPFAIANALQPLYDAASSPRDLLGDPLYEQGVVAIVAELRAGRAAGDFVFGANGLIALMAIDAVARLASDTELPGALLPLMRTGWHWSQRRAVQLLGERAQRPVAGEVLLALGPHDEPMRIGAMLPDLREFLRRDAARGVAKFPDPLERIAPAHHAFLAQAFVQLGADAPEGLREAFEASARGVVNVDALKAIGRVSQGPVEPGAEPPVVEHAAATTLRAELERLLAGDEPCSVLLSGEPGTGKSAVARLLAASLREKGWTIFEAGATDLVAGQSFVGQLEARVQEIVRALAGRRVLWIIPAFHELSFAGAHNQNPMGILEPLLPHVESGQLRILGETHPTALDALYVRHPRLRGLFSVVRVVPLADDATLELARRWATGAGTIAPPEDAVLREAALLARQYLSDQAAPGSLLRLLRLTAERLRNRDGKAATMGIDDLLETLSQLTGLPLAILDEREQLSLEKLRTRFESRVLGQPEAVECLVERVAMIKAGVTDPARPLGVFLFVGPTGTGKTQLAKTLAEFLFGGADRMIRLDMSEFQSPDTVDAILGDRDPLSAGRSLVGQIRRQPFSVVLLDEFEKAHPSVWDLFLQVFDDGRLTDRRGALADFRHAIIILTSNLGAAIPRGARIGFLDDGSTFSHALVMRSVEKTFRREFVNRIDRMVVFRPLDYGVMRDILRKELHDVFQRRGLRNREWAVEWDESAVEFLLARGFRPDLGARPLRRAVEQHLLAPLATTIVRHEVPAGDQFLFVRSDGEHIEVRFVDPDAPEPAPPSEPEFAADGTAAKAGDVAPLVTAAQGTREEWTLLKTRLDALTARVRGEHVQAIKSDALAAMHDPAFWRTPGRFATLGRAEYADRLEHALDSAVSLLNRLARSDPRARYPSDLVRSLAQQVHLLEAACASLEAGEPWEAFVAVRASWQQPEDEAAARAFARRIAAMYGAWAERRRMRFVVLADPDTTAGESRWISAVSGFGALRLLEAEHGWHVLEGPENGPPQRARVEVSVVAQPAEPAGAGEGALRAQAERALAARADAQTIVRRYREEPSPLVRDGVRGWRTGRIDRVLAGDFDVMR